MLRLLANRSRGDLETEDISGSCDAVEQPSKLGARLCQGRIRPQSGDIKSRSDVGAWNSEKSLLFDRTSTPSQSSWASAKNRKHIGSSGDVDTTEQAARLPRLKSTGDLISRNSRAATRSKDFCGSALEKPKSRSSTESTTDSATPEAAGPKTRSPAASTTSCQDEKIAKLELKVAKPADEPSTRPPDRGGVRDRFQRAREEELGEGARTLDWCVELKHPTVRCVSARISASKHKIVKSVGGEELPACIIEVCAEGFRGENLVRCSGSLVPRYSRVHINWLGRTGAVPSDPNFENAGKVGLELGCKQTASTASQDTGEDKNAGANRKRTIAQGVLATVAGIARLFGMVGVELDAEDNGSGKLVRHYTELGFRVTQAIKSFDVQMQAPMSKVMQHAPAEWLAGLVPAGFNPWGWLQPPRPSWSSNLLGGTHNPVRSVLLAADVPWAWKFPVSFPENAKIEANLSLNQSDRVLCEVYLKSHVGAELACARGSVRIAQQTLRVVGFGRSKSRPAHDTIRGKLAYRGGCTAADINAAPKDFTAATAVLGTLAALARWFGVTTIHLISTGDTSGKLLAHFKGLGFVEAHGEHPESARNKGDPVNLTASCECFAIRYCPPDWRDQLPPDDALGMLVGLSENMK